MVTWCINCQLPFTILERWSCTGSLPVNLQVSTIPWLYTWRQAHGQHPLHISLSPITVSTHTDQGYYVYIRWKVLKSQSGDMGWNYKAICFNVSVKGKCLFILQSQIKRWVELKVQKRIKKQVNNNNHSLTNILLFVLHTQTKRGVELKRVLLRIKEQVHCSNHILIYNYTSVTPCFIITLFSGRCSDHLGSVIYCSDAGLGDCGGSNYSCNCQEQTPLR